MAVHVNNPQSTGDPATDRAIRYLTDTSNEYRGHIKRLNDDLGLTRRALVDLQTAFTRQQAASAASPASSMSIEQNLGTAAQPQNAGVPFFTSDPPLSHPTSQPTQLIAVGTTPATAALKYWDGTVDPPKLVTLSTGGGGGGSSVVSITATNTISTTVEANIASLPLTAGQLNAVGKRMRTTSFGRMSFTGAGGGTQITWAMYIAPHPTPNPPSLVTARQMGVWQILMPAGAAGFSNLNWELDTELVVVAAGAGGVYHSGGPLIVDALSPTPAGTGSVVTSNNFVFASPVLDLSQTFDVVWTVRESVAGQTLTIDHASTEVLN